MSFMSRFFSVLVVALWLWSTVSLAALTPEEQRDAFNRLLNYPDQPLMSEILKEFGGEWPTLPEFYLQDSDTPWFHPTSNQDLEALARGIAIIERAFPNAVVGTLGRDAQPFGAWFEAFWIGLGQFDRRIHFAASGTSFRTGDFEQNSRFLMDSGVDLFGNDRNYLIYDATSYREEAQTRSLLRSLHWAWMNAGRDPKDLVTRAYVVGFNSHGNHSGFWDGSGSFASVVQHLEKDLADLRATENSISYPFTPSNPLFMDIKGSTTQLWSHGGEWHNGYGPLAEQVDGKTRGAPKALSPEYTRLSLLRKQLMLAREVTSSGFLVRVQKHASAFGYEFPLTPTTKLKRVKETPVSSVKWSDIKNQLTELRKSFPKYRSVSGRWSMTANGTTLHTWLQSAWARWDNADTITLELIDVVLAELEAKNINLADAAYAISYALTKNDFYNHQFTGKLTGKVKRSSLLRAIVSLDSNSPYYRFITNPQNFVWIQNSIIKPLKLNCEDDLVSGIDVSGAA